MQNVPCGQVEPVVPKVRTPARLLRAKERERSCRQSAASVTVSPTRAHQVSVVWRALPNLCMGDNTGSVITLCQIFFRDCRDDVS